MLMSSSVWWTIQKSQRIEALSLNSSSKPDRIKRMRSGFLLRSQLQELEISYEHLEMLIALSETLMYNITNLIISE